MCKNHFSYVYFTKWDQPVLKNKWIKHRVVVFRNRGSKLLSYSPSIGIRIFKYVLWTVFESANIWSGSGATLGRDQLRDRPVYPSLGLRVDNSPTPTVCGVHYGVRLARVSNRLPPLAWGSDYIFIVVGTSVPRKVSWVPVTIFGGQSPV